MNKQALKIDLIYWLTELEDEQTLEELHEIKQNRYRGELFTSEQKKELDRRLEKYEANKAEFDSWENIKQRARTNHPYFSHLFLK